MCVDKVGNLWLFGGEGFVSGTQGVWFNDLWKWDGAKWTCVKGPGPASSGAMGVPSSSNMPTAGVQPAVFWADSSGNLWYFLGEGSTQLWKWDGTNWTWVLTPA